MTTTGETLRLNREWRLREPLARGGMGRVFVATADDGSTAAVKLVPKAPGADRELLFEPISGRPNVIPILDSGEWDDQYVLVMPLAQESLRHRMLANGGKLPLSDAIPVLIDVADALAGLPDVVHRDLKPENVLLYQNHWSLSDFGIARYAEAATAPDTHKYFMTDAYAAPEQWRMQRASPATDIYAFGVMAFEILAGERPFAGPDFREQHLNAPAPPLSGVPPAIASLVAECLYKAPEARPTAANVAARLRNAQQATSPAAARLQAANEAIVQQRAQAAARSSANLSSEERRQQLAGAAAQGFERVLESLLAHILEAAPAAEIHRGPRTSVSLGNATLTVDSVRTATEGSVDRHEL